MPPRLYHVGIAVQSLEDGLALYSDRLGLPLIETEELPERQLRVAILDAGGATIELLEGTTPQSVIARFIERRGPGIHHIAFEVAQVDPQLRRLVAAGITLVDPVARPGASGTRVAFLHPRSTAGALIELVECPRVPVEKEVPLAEKKEPPAH